MMKASDIMTQEVATIRSWATVAEAVKLMQQQGWRSLIVDRCHDQDAYGILTETDIVYKVIALGKDPNRVRVFEIMTKPCITVNPDLGIDYVARLFAEHHLVRAPVIQGQLLGIISLTDILSRHTFIEQPQVLVWEQTIQAAIERAQTICAATGATSPACLSAWTEVEALQSEAAHQQAKKLPKTAFEEFCEEFPEAMQARMLDNLCSG
jgi:CBS domain-containing protein